MGKRKVRILMISCLLVIASVTAAIMLIYNRVQQDSIDAYIKPEIKPYDDVRKVGLNYMSQDIRNLDLSRSAEIIPTLTFNLDTVWPSKMPPSCNPLELLENAKNPGLGVRELHEQGITGEGIKVAIIDQPMYTDHPEFSGKIIEYKDFECNAESSMHGPAVTSLLVGETIGTAPGADLYYAAAPSWLGDSAYYADALEWLTEENRKLPEDDKIRVVSVSAAPSGEGSFFTKNNELWDEAVRKAEEEGILVLDCGMKCFITSCYYKEGNPEDPASYEGGYPAVEGYSNKPGYLFAPASPRTTAEEYVKGEYKYQYNGQGGQSWTLPYVAGVLAMGWQVNPELSPDMIVELLFESAYEADTDTLIINPPAFIELVKEQ